MADRYLINEGAKLIQVEGTTSSTGVAEAGKIIALDANGKIDSSMLPSGFGDDTKTFPASEDLAAGDFVNIFDDAGTTKIRKADPSSANQRVAHGFVKAIVLSGNNGTVYFEGMNDALSGLTPGAEYCLDPSTPGVANLCSSITFASGDIVQRVGNAVSATEINFEAAFPPIELA